MSDGELSSEGEHRTQVERDNKVTKLNIEYPSPKGNTDHPCSQKSTEYVSLKSNTDYPIQKTNK